MLKHFIVISVVICFVLSLACNNKGETPGKNVRMRAGDVPMSELASMMRDMQELSEALRTRIINNDTTDLPKLSFDLQEMKTAEPTEPSMKDDPFDAYTDHFDKVFSEIYRDDVSKKIAFNNMVESCLNCHQQFCSGPIKAITKLKIEEEVAILQ